MEAETVATLKTRIDHMEARQFGELIEAFIEAIGMELVSTGATQGYNGVILGAGVKLRYENVRCLSIGYEHQQGPTGPESVEAFKNSIGNQSGIFFCPGGYTEDAITVIRETHSLHCINMEEFAEIWVNGYPNLPKKKQNLLPLREEDLKPRAITSDEQKSMDYLAKMREGADYAETAVKTIQRALGETGGLKFIGSFRREAKTQRRNALLWGAATMAFIVSVLWLSSDILAKWSNEAKLWKSAWEIIPYLGWRGATAATLIPIIFQTTKMVKVCLNQVIINNHRANALETVESFRLATEHEGTQAKIVEKAAETAFEHIPTGITGKSANVSIPQVKI